MIRKATAADVPRMVDLVRQFAESSIEAGKLTFDEKEVRRTVFGCVSHTPRAWAAVSEIDGEVEGLLCGVAQPVYGCAKELEATDIFWFGTERCSARDKVGLMVAFTDWAKEHPKIARVMCATTAVLVENNRAGRVLERIGFSNFGTVFRMEVERPA